MATRAIVSSSLRPLLRFSHRSLSTFSHTTEDNDSPSKPQKGNSCSHRVASVVDAVNERRLPPQLRGRPNAIRSEADIENVVEHKVWRSIEEGQFENLPGKGKPLNLYTNPHVDPAEDTLYRILSKNGCSPEWVELNKEIRRMIKSWRFVLKKSWANIPNDNDPNNWIVAKDKLQTQMTDINRKVLHYNLIVPFGRQMCGLKWEKEIETFAPK